MRTGSVVRDWVWLSGEGNGPYLPGHGHISDVALGVCSIARALQHWLTTCTDGHLSVSVTFIVGDGGVGAP